MEGVDKGLVQLRGQPLVTRICAAVAPQVREIVINANRNLARYGALGYPVIQDQFADYQGPLAGMHAALQRIAQPWLLTLPCDGPFVATDYCVRMFGAAQAAQTRLAVAHYGGRLQPVYALIHRDLGESLAAFLATGERKIDRWYAEHSFTRVDFSAQTQMFVNINTPAQLADAEAELAHRHNGI